MTKIFSARAMVFLTIAVSSMVILRGAQAPRPSIAVDADDIGGVVTGARGPEAGVWVIAETRALPTRFIRIVVTDDQGRFVVPDLPKAEYDVLVRGYGLVDSAKVKASPGQTLALTAKAAPDKKAAAQYYPAQYWFAMLQLPPKSDFPGTGPEGNGLAPNVRSQGEFIRNVVNTDGCTGCHQLGNEATRTIPAEHPRLGQGFEGSLGSADSGRSGWRRNERALHAGRTRSRALDVRGLDRSRRQGRAAVG